MIYIGPISSIFDIATYLVMWYVFSCNSPEHQTLFQTGWFVEGLLSQTLIVHRYVPVKYHLYKAGLRGLLWG